MLLKFNSFKEIANKFDGVLLDAYGVFWGGNALGLLPGARELMEYLILNGKKIGVLSNSTQIASNDILKLNMHGLEKGKHFHFYLTSGEIAKNIFFNNRLPFKCITNKYFLFGDVHPKYSSHEVIFEGSIYKETKNLDEADFIYVSIPNINGKDVSDPEIFRHKIKELLISKKIMVCTNPDRFAHEGNPAKQVIRQGTIAKLYEEMNGQVYYIGKPTTLAFSYAMEEFKKLEVTSKILMVGDTPETDILGANNFGISSALVSETGIWADRIKINGFDDAYKNLSKDSRPDFIIKRFQ